MAPRSWALGLEDISEEQVDLTTLEKPEESLEHQLVEVEGLDQSISTLTEDGDQLAEDTAQVEDIHDAVEGAAEQGGMDETAAKVVDVAVEAIASRWGIRRNRIGLENFNGARKAQGTKVAMEELAEMAKDLWAKFVAWIKEIIAKLKDFWLKYFNAGKALRERADKLSDRLGKGLGEQTKAKISGSWATKLAMDGKFDVGNAISLAETAAPKINEVIGATVEMLRNANEAVAGKKTDVIRADGEKLVAFGAKTTKALNKALPAGAKNIKASALPGNKYLVSYALESGIPGIALVGGNDVDTKEVDTPTAERMKQAITAMYKLADALETRLKDFRAANDELVRLEETASKTDKDTADKKGDERATARTAAAEARAAVGNYTKLQSAVTNGLKDLATGLVGYVQAGIAAHKSVA